LCINTYTIDYKGISHHTKEIIAANVNKCKGELSDLQTDCMNARWNDEANNKQKVMMDSVLDSLTVLGESKKIYDFIFINSNRLEILLE